jgi:hypothetical protein
MSIPAVESVLSGPSLEKRRGEELSGGIRVLDNVPGILYGFSDFSYGNMAASRANNWPGQDYRANRKRFACDVGFDATKLICMVPVHGMEVVKVDKSSLAGELPEADGLITADKGVVLGLCPADCAPIIIASKEGEVVSLIHAGWKGAESGVIERAVEMFGEMGYTPEKLVAGVGPMAHCYERPFIDTLSPDKWSEMVVPVGGGLQEVDVKDNGNGVYRLSPHGGGNLWIDLHRVCTEILNKCGVREENVEVSKSCTVCSALEGKQFSQMVSNMDHLKWPVGRFLAVVGKK